MKSANIFSTSSRVGCRVLLTLLVLITSPPSNVAVWTNPTPGSPVVVKVIVPCPIFFFHVCSISSPCADSITAQSDSFWIFEKVANRRQEQLLQSDPYPASHRLPATWRTQVLSHARSRKLRLS